MGAQVVSVFAIHYTMYSRRATSSQENLKLHEVSKIHEVIADLQSQCEEHKKTVQRLEEEKKQSEAEREREKAELDQKVKQLKDDNESLDLRVRKLEDAEVERS